ncbi:hypothetical protein ACH427_06645 [Streptomyces sp. NPDC020379]|uniref:hypothetical protein n=1 Tax=Streptomyces sp. NPDC020379 TaxID=3365071 RepID=UPI0037989213
MTLTPDIQPPRTGQHNDPASVVLKFVGCVVLWLFAAYTLFVLPLSVMASDNCDQGDTRTICSVDVQQAVGLIPELTVPIALAVGTWGICSRRRWAPAAWVTAVVLLMAAWVTVGAIIR